MHDLRRFHARKLRKPDGRALWLFARDPIDEEIVAVAPHETAHDGLPSPHLRWHPFRNEWVTYARHRRTRNLLPGVDVLAPAHDPAHPTEVPPGRYDVAVFEDRFPTYHESAQEPPGSIVATAAATGVCEVVVFTQEAGVSLGALPLWHVELVIATWAHRIRELAARPDVAYVFPFENRGVEVGATLAHPHGQIHAYPFVPPIAATALAAQASHLALHGRGLLEDHIHAEMASGIRVLHASPEAVAFVPAFARFVYEVWIAPVRPVAMLPDLTHAEMGALARVLKTVLLQLDGLWQEPVPYVLSIHQAPADGLAHPEAHVHIQIFPLLRAPDRREPLAGSELGAGAFTADTFPEEQAAELRAVVVDT